MLCTYLTGGDHDADLLNGAGELIGLDSAVVVEVEVLEGLDEDHLVVGGAVALLAELLLEFLLETAHKTQQR